MDLKATDEFSELGVNKDKQKSSETSKQYSKKDWNHLDFSTVRESKQSLPSIDSPMFSC